MEFFTFSVPGEFVTIVYPTYLLCGFGPSACICCFYIFFVFFTFFLVNKKPQNFAPKEHNQKQNENHDAVSVAFEQKFLVTYGTVQIQYS